MDMMNKFLNSDDNISMPGNLTDKYLKIKKWLASLNPADRTSFTNKYLVPVFGEQAAEWVKQQLTAERKELEIELDNYIAELRMKYADEVQPRILKHIGETLKKIEKEKNRVSFKDPILKALWDVASARTGLDVVAAGQTTFENMLSDFDKLMEVLLRMSQTFEKEKSPRRSRARNTE